jgi:uncharacterized protein (TIGR03437 family)
VKAGSAVRFRVVSAAGFSVTASGLPAGATFDSESGLLEWLTSANDLGTYEVTFSIAGPSGSLSKATAIEIGSGLPMLTNVRSYVTASDTGVCSSGSPATAMGRFLSTSTVPVERATGDWTELGDTRVKIGGDYARLLSVSAERVDFICPTAPPGTELAVSVETLAGRSQSASIVVSAPVPGILTVSRDGKGQAVAFREGASDLAAIPEPELNGAPATGGDTLSVLVTGIGCDPSTVTPMPLLRFGDQYALAKSVVPLPGQSGICRVKVEVPAGMPSGRTALTLEIPGPDGNLTSNTASIAIEN